MKNIILKVDDETYRKACIRAAEAGTSVSAMVREFLNRDEEALHESRRIKAMKALYELVNKRAKSTSEPVKPLSRDEIYATCLH